MRSFLSTLISVWNAIWKKTLVWNGRFLVWSGNGMKKNASMEYGKIVFHSIACPEEGTAFTCMFSRLFAKSYPGIEVQCLNFNM